jgi:branched-chain amino acid transport system ATP-binding protein
VPLLEIRGLRKSFGSVMAVDDVDLAIAAGEALGIIGPNGAGKTTLFNLIAGGLFPDAGTIHLDGREIAGTRPHERCMAGIARTYQIPRPFEHLTVFENLLVAAIHSRRMPEADATQRCGEILESCQLLSRANAFASSLTLLERKRLEMARALATAPRLLLLDEIAGGLTEAECVALVDSIKGLRTTGLTIIWIEHIVHALVAVVDQLMVLNFGRKLAEGSPDVVMSSPTVKQIYMGIAA